MKLTFEIPDEELKCMLQSAMYKHLVPKMLETWDSRQLKKMYREVIKSVVYEPEMKKKIIDSTVKQAAAEIKRRVMPKLAESLFQTEKEDR